jgi:hypothetical protein
MFIIPKIEANLLVGARNHEHMQKCLYCDGTFVFTVENQGEIPEKFSEAQEAFLVLCQISFRRNRLHVLQCERCKRKMLMGVRYGNEFAVLPVDFLKEVIE